MRPRLIRSDLGEGNSSWVPYGISVDVSEFQQELLKRTDELVEEQLRSGRAAVANGAAHAASNSIKNGAVNGLKNGAANGVKQHASVSRKKR